MLLDAIPLDATMHVIDVLRRLARNGLWLDPHDVPAAEWIKETRARLRRAGLDPDFGEVAARLRRDPARAGIAIRRQWYNQILWYPRVAQSVLESCHRAKDDDTLMAALGLQETDSRPLVAAGDDDRSGEYVVAAGGFPVSISPPGTQPRRSSVPVRPAPVEEGVATTRPEADRLRMWPYLAAPDRVFAEEPFLVVVGLANAKQGEVVGEQVAFPTPSGAAAVDLTVELSASGAEAPEGWTRTLTVQVAEPDSARVTFRLVGRRLLSLEPVYLSTISVRYLREGTLCGIASRPLEIWSVSPPPSLEQIGAPWSTKMGGASGPIDIPSADDEPDLTIEISKHDGNSATGLYDCRLYSPHPLSSPRGPHLIDFGDDTRTFAKGIVDEIRNRATDRVIVGRLLSAFGKVVADKLPDAAHDALYGVADYSKPKPPTVLVVSAEPYVPWELAVLDAPIDASLPPYLGAQTLLGRWLRDAPLDAAVARSPVRPGRRHATNPPLNPPREIPVPQMVAIAGKYEAKAGVRALPHAEEEVRELEKTHHSITLAASSLALLQVLDGDIVRDGRSLGAPGAVHFAGHGAFNPNNADSSVILLDDGSRLLSVMFRDAKYGGDRQPLMFLNACMVGIGGEMLGDSGGFPGHCLKGGFGALLGALWEVDDVVGRDVALEFWHRALPPDGTPGEPVSSVLRDLRARFSASNADPTFLAYVYYGHPRLQLQRKT